MCGFFLGNRPGPKDAGKLRHVGRVRVESLQQLRDVEGHFHWVSDRVHGLLFKITAAAIPEQRSAVAAHHQAGRIAAAVLAVMAKRYASAIGKRHVGFMAGRTGNLP